MAKIRVRIAPSPTGFAHVGTAYTALFNYAFARKLDGDIVLRLEDTDTKREVEGAEEAIYLNLDWLGVSWDEGPDKGGAFGPYRQSERLDLYQKKAKELVDKGLAYEDEGAVRFKNPGEDISWNDLIRGEITFPGQEVQDFVILKSDGFPTFHFAVVVDDIAMEISHVIRGEDHISNTPKHLALFRAFSAAPPEFAHFPTLRSQDKTKLSKRRDPVDLGLYRKEGYLPEALVNFLCLLGWSHPEEKEIFSLSEFVENFTLERVRKSGPVFDVKKLDWINGMYIRQMEDEVLARLLNDHITADTSVEFLKTAVPLIKERINKLEDAEPLLSFFWNHPTIGRETFIDESSAGHIADALVTLRRTPEWNLDEINSSLSKTIEEKSFKTGNFYMTLRLALAGTKITPPINESMVILGKDEVLHRLEEAQKVLL